LYLRFYSYVPFHKMNNEQHCLHGGALHFRSPIPDPRSLTPDP
jgi:hypothetical protein